MGAKIKEILQKLSQKEKIIIIASASALAVVLITVALLLAFCGTGDSGSGDGVGVHTHTYGDFKLEKVDGKFNLIGKCTAAGCPIPDFLLKDVKTEIKSETQTACGYKEIVYSFNYDGTEVTYSEGIVVESNHRLNGKFENEFLDENRVANYDIPGVKIFSGGTYECEGTVDGYYMCDDCQQLVQINVFKPHIGELAVTLEPDCDTLGKESTVCKDCGVILAEGDDIPALGHSYEYEISGNTVIGKCVRKGCTDPDYREENVKNLTLVEKIPSVSCAAPGKLVYSYTDSKGEKVTVTVVDKDASVKDHTLNGKDASTYLDKDGYFAFNVKGVTPFNALKCANPGEVVTDFGYYTCEECGQMVPVTIVMPTHNMIIAGTVNPSKTKDGITYLRCSYAHCDVSFPIVLPKIEIGKNATVIVEADVGVEEVVKYWHIDNVFNERIELEITISSKHDHEYIYTIEEKDGKTNIIGKCTVNKCTDPDYVWDSVTDLKETHRHPATCQTGEMVEYTCKTKIGDTLNFFVYVGEKLNGHILNGVLAKPDVTVTVTVEGEEKQIQAYTYTGGKDGIKLFGSTEFKPGDVVSGYFICEHCKQPVQIQVYIPKDYTGN